MRLTRTFKRSGVLLALGIALTSVFGDQGFGVAGILLIVFSSPVFAVSAIRHLLRGLLWRVGSRLLLSYVLIGVVPIPLVTGLLFVGSLVLAGQFGARRTEAAFVKRQTTLQLLATSLAPRLAEAPSAPARAALFEQAAADHRHALPGLSYVFVPKGGVVEGTGALAKEAPAWKTESGRFLGRLDERLYTGALEERAGARLIVYLPVDRALRQALERETGIELRLRTIRVEKEGGNLNISVDQPPRKKGVSFRRKDTSGNVVELQDSETPSATKDDDATAAPPVPRGVFERRLVVWGLLLDQPVLDLKTGTALAKSPPVGFTVRTSLAHEFRALFAGSRIGGENQEASQIAVRAMQILGAMALSIYGVASLIAAILVLRIARATRRMSNGFSEIRGGNFAFRARLRGEDQLASMIESFNQMAGHLETSVATRAEKEALEHELQVARDLQRRLLPSPDFRFPGVEIATDFLPAAAIGGDFYHFVAEGDDRLVVVIADVSGHGLSTGIVMASAKASLSALASTGAKTPDLFATLDREIRATTERRTFVTLAHARFHLSEKRLEFTNAGHIYPYRIEPNGTVSSVPNPARPLGLPLAATFQTVTSPVTDGDLWVFVSDGIVEATSQTGDVFGFARFEETLARGAGKTAAELKDLVLAEWLAFSGREQPEDDRTLIVVRILPA